MEASIKYFITAFSFILLMILYVWQNVEVMKIKMDYRETLKKERQLIKMNDKIRYEIELFKRMDRIEDFALSNGMRKISYKDFETIIIKD